MIADAIRIEYLGTDGQWHDLFDLSPEIVDDSEWMDRVQHRIPYWDEKAFSSQRFSHYRKIKCWLE